MLTFLLDENIDIRIAIFLKNKGYIVNLCPKGIQNGNVVALAKKKKQILLTNDKDFSNTDVYNPSNLSGIVVFRIHPPSYLNLSIALGELLSNYRSDDFIGKLFVVSLEGVQIE